MVIKKRQDDSGRSLRLALDDNLNHDTGIFATESNGNSEALVPGLIALHLRRRLAFRRKYLCKPTWTF